MKVRYSPRATRDLAAIREYLSGRSPIGAANVMAAIFAAIEFIRRYPRGAEKTNIPGVHGKIVNKYRFKIFYRVIDDEDVIEIVHIRHTSRRPWQGE
jgi:plasmid stabilization system protein ParE